MGTRSLTVIKDGDKNDEEIVVMYSQFDGYLSGHGKLLKEAIGDLEVVNGYSPNNTNVANGMSCLAAQLIMKFKQTRYDQQVRMREVMGREYEIEIGYAGTYYLHPAGTRDCGEEYVYTVYFVEKDEALLEQEREAERLRFEKEFEEAPDEEAKLKVKRFESPSLGQVYVMVEYDDTVIYDGPLRDLDPNLEVEVSDEDEISDEEGDRCAQCGKEFEVDMENEAHIEGYCCSQCMEQADQLGDEE